MGDESLALEEVTKVNINGQEAGELVGVMKENSH